MRGIKYAAILLFLFCLCALGACAPLPFPDKATIALRAAQASQTAIALQTGVTSPTVTLTATQTATHVVTSTATTNTKRIPVLHLKGNGCRDQETGLDRCQISKEITPTLERIKRGIKDPHRNDGTIFTNREGILPRQRSDYYHEYVVPTPGQSGPGARRIVMGAKGEIYYTRDHYASFIQVIV